MRVLLIEDDDATAQSIELMLRSETFTDGLCVDLERKTVEIDGVRVYLTAKEYQMLELLALRKGTTLTKEMILNHLYGGMDEPEIKIIDVFICKLRKKLANASGGKNFIETIWGRGYALRAQAKSFQPAQHSKTAANLELTCVT
jgi:two-component system, cell cycle response regulator CtrA